MIRRWLSRFMMGRYGTDILSLVLLCTALVLSLVGQFSRLWIFLLLSYVPLVYAIFRTLSRQTAKRYAENQKFLSWFRGIKNWFSRKKARSKDTDHCFIKCPGCHQTLRLPKGKGRITITCPKCRTSFVRKV